MPRMNAMPDVRWVVMALMLGLILIGLAHQAEARTLGLPLPLPGIVHGGAAPPHGGKGSCGPGSYAITVKFFTICKPCGDQCPGNAPAPSSPQPQPPAVAPPSPSPKPQPPPAAPPSPSPQPQPQPPPSAAPPNPSPSPRPQQPPPSKASPSPRPKPLVPQPQPSPSPAPPAGQASPSPPLFSPAPPTRCNPCSEDSPDVLLTTGANADPANGMYRIRGFARGAMDLKPEFLCALTSMGGMVGDVAIVPNGAVYVVDLACDIHQISAQAYAALRPTDVLTTPCGERRLAHLAVPTGTTCTGLSVGPRSDLLLVSTNGGEVIELTAIEAPWGLISGVRSRAQAANDPSAGRDLTSGGTDLSFGPDRELYRWSAKDRQASYTGTRFAVDGVTSRLTGGHTWTNRGLGSAEADSNNQNAGVFCTSWGVVGVAASRRAGSKGDERDMFASFFSFGVGVPQGVAPDQLKPATLVAQTRPFPGRPAALLVNGAAVRPACGL